MGFLIFLLGGMDAFLTYPFHGPLREAILSVMDTQVWDEETLNTVHDVIDLRLEQMDTLLDEVFTSELAPITAVITGEYEQLVKSVL